MADEHGGGELGDVELSSDEMTRIYRETADDALRTGDRLTVLLAPYARAFPRQRRRDDGDD